MPGPHNEKCDACYFYAISIDPQDEGCVCGSCHRYPPSAWLTDEMSEIARYKFVHRDGWCGEFKPL